jgi:hypothetical protein
MRRILLAMAVAALISGQREVGWLIGAPGPYSPKCLEGEGKTATCPPSRPGLAPLNALVACS